MCCRLADKPAHHTYGCSEFSVEQDSCPTLRRARVCSRIEPLSFAPSRASRSGQQFLVRYGDVVCGVADHATSRVQNVRTVHVAFSVDLRALSCEFRKNRKEPNVFQSRGAIRFEPLFTTADIGLRPEASVEHVVKAFLNVGEALAARWIEMPRGALLLQSVPDEPASGAIYLYDRERHIFYFVSFLDGRDDALTVTEFDQLVLEYDLVSRAANPAVFSPYGSKPGLA